MGWWGVTRDDRGLGIVELVTATGVMAVAIRTSTSVNAGRAAKPASGPRLERASDRLLDWAVAAGDFMTPLPNACLRQLARGPRFFLPFPRV